MWCSSTIRNRRPCSICAPDEKASGYGAATSTRANRIADVVLQKSLKEGFGLTVAEAMWKAKPVIGGDVGGIRIQAVNHQTGFLVNTPEGAASRIRYLLTHRERLLEMGRKAKRFILENYLLTRHLREYLSVMLSIRSKEHKRIDLRTAPTE
ncbi:glycosyltransferase [Desulfatitalea alkaliphila]|uniref:glycosyltransferase n=1 Tax=Desulfatitalea alkaliphila TaxID=2929485 RepID=UPI003CCF8667